MMVEVAEIRDEGAAVTFDIPIIFHRPEGTTRDARKHTHAGGYGV
jgi:hypothetical protein